MNNVVESREPSMRGRHPAILATEHTTAEPDALPVSLQSVMPIAVGAGATTSVCVMTITGSVLVGVLITIAVVVAVSLASLLIWPAPALRDNTTE